MRTERSRVLVTARRRLSLAWTSHGLSYEFHCLRFISRVSCLRFFLLRAISPDMCCEHILLKEQAKGAGSSLKEQGAGQLCCPNMPFEEVTGSLKWVSELDLALEAAAESMSYLRHTINWKSFCSCNSRRPGASRGLLLHQASLETRRSCCFE